MKILYIIIGVTGWVFALLVWSNAKHSNHPIFIPIHYTEGRIPYSEGIIDDVVTNFEIHFATKLPCGIENQVLEKISKTPYGEVSWHDINNNSHTAPTYIIPKIKLGNLVLTELVANGYSKKEDSDAQISNGFIGWHILKKYNLLLDFPNNALYACDRASFPKKLGFSPKDFIKIPFKKHYTGIIVEIDSDLGKKRLEINTTSNVSVLAQDSTTPFVSKKITTSHLFFGDSDFGERDFYFVDYPEALQAADGFLGMDFLSQHTIYIDYPNSNLYIKKPNV